MCPYQSEQSSRPHSPPWGSEAVRTAEKGCPPEDQGTRDPGGPSRQMQGWAPSWTGHGLNSRERPASWAGGEGGVVVPGSLGQGVNPKSSAPSPRPLAPPIPLGRVPAGALGGELLPPEGTWGAGSWRWAFEAHFCQGAAGRPDVLNSSSDLGLCAGEESGRIALPWSSSAGGPTAAVRASPAACQAQG